MNTENVYKNYLIIALVIIFLVYIFNNYKSFQFKENLENVSPENKLIIDQIYDYFMNDKATKYTAYLDFLISIKNKNLSLINSDVFSNFKFLRKRNELTKNDIAKEMNIIV
jgi:hypothetical protein